MRTLIHFIVEVGSAHSLLSKVKGSVGFQEAPSHPSLYYSREGSPSLASSPFFYCGERVGFESNPPLHYSKRGYEDTSSLTFYPLLYCRES